MLAGLTQRELAERMNVSQSYLSRVESAAITITNQDLTRWLTACGATDELGDLSELNLIAHRAIAADRANRIESDENADAGNSYNEGRSASAPIRQFTLIDDGRGGIVHLITRHGVVTVTDPDRVDRCRDFVDQLVGAVFPDHAVASCEQAVDTSDAVSADDPGEQATAPP